jgi:hypothetical protein
LKIRQPANAGFILESGKVTVRMGDQDVALRIPSFADYLILKLFSERPSDVRDIVALVWQRGIPGPDALLQRAEDIAAPFQRLVDNLELAIKDVSETRFPDSWRGTFMTQESTEAHKRNVLGKLLQVKKAIDK